MAKRSYQKPELRSEPAFGDAVLAGDCCYFNETSTTCLKTIPIQCQCASDINCLPPGIPGSS
jgi:hypothetical protein